MTVFHNSVILLTFLLVSSAVISSIIIVEDAKACFRRVLAGKRVARGFVKRSLVCERIEDCQRECADEKYFVCEGFNYRLDPSGRAKGECELLDVPIARLDIGRDLYPDPDYDYYERDRNAAVANCNRRRVGYPVGSGYGEGGGYGGGYHSDRRYDYEDGYGKRPDYDSWSDDRNRFGSGSRNPRPDFDRRPDDYDWYDNEYRPNGNRRGGKYLPSSTSSDKDKDSIIWDVLCLRFT